MAAREITFDIVKNIGVLTENKTGWRREINIVSWNGAKPKLDIRDWGPEHQKVGKGLSLNAEEVAILKELIADYDPYEIEE